MVSDRHDNIGMDPFAAEVGKVAGAKVLIDAGDDSSSGQSWEGFSINSLAQHFKDLKVVAVAGNHDAGGYIEDAMRKNKFTVLDSKPVEVEGIRFLGDSDPTRTGLGSADTPGDETTAQQSERLADVACEQPETSRSRRWWCTTRRRSRTPRTAAARPCCCPATCIARSARTRKIVEGRSVTTYTNGTTGGAAYAFALGYTLRRPGEVTLVTYVNGVADRPADRHGRADRRDHRRNVPSVAA